MYENILLKYNTKIYHKKVKDLPDKNKIEIEKDLRVSMTKPFFDKLNEIKEFYGIKNYTEIIRFMINFMHRNIQKEDL